MAENTGIEWADHTFNPWIGCTKVSPACDFCYAENFAKRIGQAELWQGERRLTGDSNWAQPLRWNRKAAAEGRRYRVFCASLADVFDNQVPTAWRDRLWKLIHDTPHLDWLLLTKRPQNIRKMLPSTKHNGVAWGQGWPNVWLGTTVENQDEADRRILWLLDIPARVRFLSCEPLLGPVDLTRVIYPKFRQQHEYDPFIAYDVLRGHIIGPDDVGQAKIDWVICGGESGPKARAMHPDWSRGLRDQCQAAGVAFLFKQHGEWIGVPDLRLLPGGSGPGFGDFDHAGYDDEHEAVRVGKKAAGRMLDGRTWDEFPKVAA
ncbi:phage Gp37/Gp68 family protein [Inquilinus sp.]|jgi:protein gp37|uniref:phage Gp37/Gp68 family protein n=1 Tax=Inquilinus sp. TaxID=1932117 RepID=UPI0037834199